MSPQSISTPITFKELPGIQAMDARFKRGFDEWRNSMIVYAIRNILDGKMYVGSTRSRKGRWNNHRYFLRLGKHQNRHLQDAYKKHGPSAFVFEVLEKVEEGTNLREAEKRWFEQTQCCNPEFGYNVYPDPTNLIIPEESRRMMSETRRGRKLSLEHVEAISRGLTGLSKSKEHREKLRAANLGKRFSPKRRACHAAQMRRLLTERNQDPEHRKKVSAGLAGHTVSDETRRKISAMKKGKKLLKKRKISEADRATIKTRVAAGETKAAMAREFGVTHPAIRYILRETP